MSISEIIEAAKARGAQNGLPYCGALMPSEAYTLLQTAPGAKIVDVRTRAEWNFVGSVPGAVQIECVVQRFLRCFDGDLQTFLTFQFVLVADERVFDLFRSQQWMTDRQQVRGRTQFDALCASGHSGQQGQGRGYGAVIAEVIFR